MLWRLWLVIVTCRFLAIFALLFGDDVLVEVLVIVPATFLFVPAMFTHVDGGEVSTILVCDFFDLHGCFVPFCFLISASSFAS